MQLSTQGQGLYSVFLPRCLGTSLDFTLTLSEGPHHGGGGAGWRFQMTSALDNNELYAIEMFSLMPGNTRIDSPV